MFVGEGFDEVVVVAGSFAGVAGSAGDGDIAWRVGAAEAGRFYVVDGEVIFGLAVPASVASVDEDFFVAGPVCVVAYSLRADSMEEALKVVAEEKTPTATDGADHYVVTDGDIVYSLVREDR